MTVDPADITERQLKDPLTMYDPVSGMFHVAESSEEDGARPSSGWGWNYENAPGYIAVVILILLIADLFSLLLLWR